MTRSATMALEQACDEEIINEAPVQLTDSAEASVAETIGNLMSFMPAVADQFMLSVQAATAKLADRVDSANTLTPHEIKVAKEEFVGAMLEAAGQLMSQREWLVDEIRNYDGLWQGKVLKQIEQTQAAVESEELQIRAMTDNEGVDLSVVMRSISTLNEKKAYLEGLKFQIPDKID